MYIFSGIMDYHVKGQTLRLYPGDCVLLNSRQMHYVTPVRFQDSTFTCILFHPCLLCENQKLYARYVASIINNPNFEYSYYPTTHPFYREISTLILDIISFKQQKFPGYEMLIIGHMHNFWCQFIQVSNLLKDQDISIMDVAAYCGFSSCSYFTAQFHSTYGVTPREYRKTIL